MSVTARFRSFVRSVMHRSRVETEMESELRFHLEKRAEDLEAAGLSPLEAMRQARIEMGPVATHKDGMRRSLGLRLLDELKADVSYAARMLRRSPGFTAVAIGSLALGIGANTVIFTLAKGILFDKLAVNRPEELRLFTMYTAKQSPIHAQWGSFFPAPDGRQNSTSLSYPVYELLRKQNQANPVLSDLFAFKDLGDFKRCTITADNQSDAVFAQLVSGNLYEQLQVRTELGRPIQPADDATPGAGAVAVISDTLWSRMFARSPDVIGKAIQINLIPFTIIGVNPPEFTGAASVQISPDVFVPLSMQPVLVPWRPTSLLGDKRTWWLQVMARTKPGVSDEKARAAIAVWLEDDIRATMKIAKGDQMPLFLLNSGSQGEALANRNYGNAIYVLLALTGFVLLLACANLANLLLARSSSRQRELAVRLAMGATRGRIMRQVLTESLLLSSLGGATGLLLGYCGRNVIPHLLSSSWQPTPVSPRFDIRIFAFTAAISIVTGILFGIAPAWQATRTEVNTGLKDSSASATRRRSGLAGRVLVVLQVALSMLLVVGAGLFTRTLSNLNKSNLGFDPSHILLFSLQAPGSRYPAPKNIELHDRVEQRIAGIPGVQSVTLLGIPLVADGLSDTDFIPTDQPERPEGKSYAMVNDVGRDFFSTFRIPILYGRGFASTDTATSQRVAVINQTLAKRYYGTANPIGKTFKSDYDIVYEVIGISRDAKYNDLRKDFDPTFYKLYNQSHDDDVMTYAVKSDMPESDLLPKLRDAVREVDRDLPLRDIRTQQEQIDATIMQQRLFATLTASFGVLALTLACIGIYGIMAYNVARRTNEIGVRMALGARGGQVLAMVLRESIWMAVIGIAVGLGGAYGLTRFIRSMLFGLKPMDVGTLVGAGVVLFVVAIAAGYGPARRASRIDPMVALRHE